MNKENDILLRKIETFIRKYYKNQLLKGLILGLSLCLVSFFTVTLLEYLGHFGTATRTVLFSLFALISLVVIFWYIIRPLAALNNISGRMNEEMASMLIGMHFPEVSDKLLNTLQLQQGIATKQTNALLLASIEQRTAELSPIPFNTAIRFKTNLKYVKYVLLPALVLVLILLISPGFKQSSERIVKFNRHFEIQAPFRFIFDEKQLDAVQNQDIRIKLDIRGDAIPEEVYIHLDNARYRMKSETTGQYAFELKNLQKNMNLHFEAGGFDSKNYQLNVLPKPALSGYEASLIYPDYLHRDNEKLNNTSDISIPEGTSISWKFNTKNVDQIRVLPQDKYIMVRSGGAQFKDRFKKSISMRIKTSNAFLPQGDSLYYRIRVIPDEFPSISVNSQPDSLSNKVLYFIGDIGDDYGFSRLSFHYVFKNKKGKDPNRKGEQRINFDPKVHNQTFYHLWNLNELGVEAEDEIEYYFSVWDNDGVNGAKMSKTAIMQYKAPSLEEIEQETEKSNTAIKSNISGARKEAERLEQETKSVQKMLTEKKQLDWNEKKKIEDLLNKHKELEKQVKEVIEQNLEKNMKEEEFKPVDEALLEKQKKLEELFNDIMDEEMKELMEKIQKLMRENRMDQLQNELQKLEFSEKEMNKELDRMLELFKELELEKKLSETIDKLNELAEKQRELSEKSAKENKKNERLLKEQENLNRNFERVEEDIKEIEKKNSELESPKNIKIPEQLRKETEEQMKEGIENIEKGKNSKASENQKNASDKMKEMAADMQAQMEEAYEEQQAEDYGQLRQILENLVQLSFDQEELIEEFKKNKQYSPEYVELRQQQQKIRNESKMVEDSLLALSKRVIEIQHFVNEEIGKINQNLEYALAHLGERSTGNALVNQQHVMTGYNNLALMLSESLNQMQQQMKMQQQNKGKPKSECKKPGNEGKPQKPNMNAIKKMQEELAKQLEEMQKGMKPGGQKMGTGSKEYAEMATRQEAIRRKLQELERDLKKEGRGNDLGDLKRTQDMMDEIEKDLYYKQLNSETMRRMKEIEIRLSEHENAEQEQEQEDRRNANEGKEVPRELPPNIKKYLEEKNKELELLRSVSPELEPYYHEKVKEYFGS